MSRMVHRGVWTPADRAESIYRYLPFDVPPGAEALSVHLSYDRTRAVLDLGCAGAAGFRGWSGGARDRFVIRADAATPGFLPGRLEPGTWQVMLGLHRIPPDGVGFEVVVEVGSFTPPRAPPPPPRRPRPPARRLPAEPGRRWLAGDLHAHTVHSDGELTVHQLAVLAASCGLDVLAVTDHNTISHHAELPRAAAHADLLLLSGQELTTDTGHANAFGDIGWVDFRGTADDWLAATEDRGGLLSINHPLAGDCSWRRAISRRPPLAEIWHSGWFGCPESTRPLRWWCDWGQRVTPIGGSDYHRPNTGLAPGQPTTWVECAGADGAAVLDALGAGRVTLSAAPDGPVLIRRADELLVLDGEGTILVGPDGSQRPIRENRQTMPTSGSGPHRLMDPGRRTLALTP